RPDVPEESARKTLRNALYELRRALGDGARDALVVDGDRVGLAEGVRVDVREFRRLAAAGDLEAAAEAGAGELLAGFDGDWALRARARSTPPRSPACSLSSPDGRRTGATPPPRSPG